MTEESSESIDDVRALVAERHRFDEWLSALESRRDDTPDHVYERVHRDYQERRRDVMTKLHDHVPGLDTLLAELDGRAEDLSLRARAEEDERAEAMLRHAVGEFDDDKWNEVRERVESTLSTLSEERDALDAQRADVGALLKSARPEPVAAVVVDVVADVVADVSSADAEAVSVAGGDATVAVDDAGADVAGADVAGADVAGADVAGADAAGADDQAVDQVAGAREHDSSENAGQRDAAARSESPSRESENDLEKVDALELTPESAEPPPAPAFERPSIWGTPRPARDVERKPTSGTDADEEKTNDVFGDARSEVAERRRASDVDKSARSTPKSGAPADGFDELAFLRSVIDPQAKEPNAPRAPKSESEQKTLRCTECGSMNLPTEWYCERCGGELAAF